MIRSTIFAVLALCVAVSAGHAAKGKKAGNGARVIARFDRDSSGTINGEEAVRVQAAYAALAKLDTDKNGELSESELATAEIPPRKKKRK